jgi:copper chaperone CopZ
LEFLLIKVSIEGMSCEHCVRAVYEALEGIDGVTAVEVNLRAGLALMDTTLKVSDEQIIAALDEDGYDVKSIIRS